MLIDNLRLPEYLRSTDFKTFEGLLKLLGITVKNDVDEITNLKDYSKCAEHMLPLLANYIGCPYFDKTTVYANRLIIKNWWHMMRTKGTLPTLQLAVSLALVAYDAAEGRDIDLFGRSVELVLDTVTGNLLIRVLYESDTQKELSDVQVEWIEDIIKYVKPAGFNTIYIPSQFLHAYLEVDATEDVRIIKFQYEPNFESGVGLSYKEPLSVTTINIKQIIEEILNTEPDFDMDNILCPMNSFATLPVDLPFRFQSGGQFGQYHSRNSACTNCLYNKLCEAFAMLGLGQQELSGAGKVLDGGRPSIVERKSIIDATYLDDYTWEVTSPHGYNPSSGQYGDSLAFGIIQDLYNITHVEIDSTPYTTYVTNEGIKYYKIEDGTDITYYDPLTHDELTVGSGFNPSDSDSPFVIYFYTYSYNHWDSDLQNYIGFKYEDTYNEGYVVTIDIFSPSQSTGDVSYKVTIDDTTSQPEEYLKGNMGDMIKFIYNHPREFK